jgi:hypothetical protein
MARPDCRNLVLVLFPWRSSVWWRPPFPAFWSRKRGKPGTNKVASATSDIRYCAKLRPARFEGFIRRPCRSRSMSERTDLFEDRWLHAQSVIGIVCGNGRFVSV